MSLTLLTGADLDSASSITDGEYYVEASTGLPRNQSAGYFKQVTYNDGSDDIFVLQEFKGLRSYGDTELGDYERFAFPKELGLGLNAKELKWQKRKPLVYLDEK